jgi:PAS domain-containing protein
VPSLLTRHYDAAVAATWSPLLRYGLAILSVACAFLLTQLVPEVQTRTPFLFYMLAVAVTSLYGGLGPGTLSAVLGLLTAASWNLPSLDAPQISNPYPLHTIGFVIIATIIVLSSYALRRSRRGQLSERQAFVARLRYQAFLLDHVNDAVCVIDRDLRLLYWNRGAEMV